MSVTRQCQPDPSSALVFTPACRTLVFKSCLGRAVWIYQPTEKVALSFPLRWEAMEEKALWKEDPSHWGRGQEQKEDTSETLQEGSRYF